MEELEIPQDIFESLPMPLSELIKLKINYATLLISKEDYNGALNEYQHILWMKCIKPNSKQAIFINFKRALVFLKIRNYNMASNLLKGVARQRMLLFGGGDRLYLRALSYLSMIWNRLDSKVSWCQFKNILREQKKLYGIEDRDTLQTRMLYLPTLLSLNRNDKVFSSCEILLDQRNIHHFTSLQILAIKNYMALALAAYGDYEKAVNTFLEIHYSRKEYLGIEHSDTLRPLSFIAYVYHLEKKFSEATHWYKYIIKFQKKYLGKKHYDTLWSQLNYGNLLFYIGDYSQHIRVHKGVLNMSSQSEESGDILTLKLLINASQMLRKQTNPTAGLVSFVLSMWNSNCLKIKLIKDFSLLLKKNDEQTILEFVQNNRFTTVNY